MFARQAAINFTTANNYKEYHRRTLLRFGKFAIIKVLLANIMASRLSQL